MGSLWVYYAWVSDLQWSCVLSFNHNTISAETQMEIETNELGNSGFYVIVFVFCFFFFGANICGFTEWKNKSLLAGVLSVFFF